MGVVRLVALLCPVLCLFTMPTVADLHREAGAEQASADSISPESTFANDSTLSPMVRAAITQSAKRLGSSQKHSSSKLLVPGTFGADELPPAAEGQWYGMRIAGHEASIVRVKVRLHRVPNVRATGNRLIPGARVEVDTSDSLLFMIRGDKWAPQALVPTWFVGRGTFSPDFGVQLPGQLMGRWRISTSKPKRYPNGTVAYAATVHDGVAARSQEIGRWQVGTSPEILWIGDLDGDGGLDMFVSDGTSETGSRHWFLYLSSHAKRGDLFGRAAMMYTPGC